MIHVIATAEIHEGKVEEFLTAFRQLMPLVHAETGCIEYGPTRDLTTGLGAQIPIRPNVVTIVEKWESLDALRAHLAAPHMQEYRERVRNLVAGVTLQVLEPVG